MQKSSIDIFLIAEGTYPYVRGGVSTWIHQLVTNLPQFKFGIFHLGAIKGEEMEFKYQLPENVFYYDEVFIFNETQKSEKKRVSSLKEENIVRLHDFLKAGDETEEFKSLLHSFKLEHLLYSKEAWEYIKLRYEQKWSDLPYLDYFWTVRNMHVPIFALLEAIKKFPETKLFHSPTTGYAGFMGALASIFYDKPLIITEHGIYTRERKIDLMQAEWINYNKPKLLASPEETNAIKQIWIDFFVQLGKFAYERASKIIALYPDIQKVQIELGAPKEKLMVIPNGVDIEKLKEHRNAQRKKNVIALIGRVVPIKDIKTFIRAIHEATNELPDVEGWIIGPTDEDENYYLECLEMVKNFDLKENVQFLGFQNIHDILPKVKLLTLTSISEGMPLVVLEGFAAGLPAVTTEVGSCATLINGGIDEADKELGIAGAVVPIANPQALAKEYVRFLKSESLWRAAQRSAIKRVERYYTKRHFIEGYAELYQEVINGWHRI